MKSNAFVFDSSAIIALLQQEEGSEIVANSMKGGIMSSLNYSEVVAVLARKMPRETIVTLLAKLISEIVPFDEDQAVEVGIFYRKTKSAGLSMGDRACITPAKLPKIPVLTADKEWAKLNLGVEIKYS